MDHGEALTTKASERYLLGEMSEPERFDFESHYFTCEACAEDVRTGVVLARGIKAANALTPSPSRDVPEREIKQKRRWFDWLSPMVLAPSTAAVALAMLAGYQAFVVIPPMRETAAPQAMTPVILRAVARGEDPVIQVERKPGLSVLALDVNSGSPGQPITYQLLPPGGATAITGATQVPPAGSQLVLALSNATLQHAGAWTLVLRTPQGADAGSYPFRIEVK